MYVSGLEQKTLFDSLLISNFMIKSIINRISKNKLLGSTKKLTLLNVKN